MDSKLRILCVGIACTDLIINTDGFRPEDSMNVCSDVRRQSGGNATNDSKILSLLGEKSEILVTLSSDPDGQGNSTEFLLEDFRKHGVSYENCVFHKNRINLSSVVIINTQNGSRTIYHHMGNLPELMLSDFSSLNLSNYKWIHFESRNTEQYVLMMKAIAAWNAARHPDADRIKVSTEVEYPYDEYHSFFPMVDLLFISKDVARLDGIFTKEAAARHFSSLMRPGGIAVCPWGEEGAAACVRDNDDVIVSSAFPPSNVVDTLGCGDTFDSGVIYALADNRDLKTAIRFGCRLAGYKCSIRGYAGLADVGRKLYEETLQEALLQ